MKRPSTVSLFCLCIAGLLCSLLLGGHKAQAAPQETIEQQRKRCLRLFRQPLLLDAASCFLLLYRRSKSTRDLWYIAESYRLAAENQRSPFYTVQLHKKAIYYYRLYKKKNPSGAHRAQRKLRPLRRKVWRLEKKGYAQVWVEGEPERVRYVLRRDGKIVTTGRLPLREDLPPGRYEMTLRRKGYHPQKVMVIVRKNRPVYIRQKMRPRDESPPQPAEYRSPEPPSGEPVARPGAPPPGPSRAGGGGGGRVPRLVPWIVLGVSALFSLTGGIFVAVSAGHHAAIRVVPQANDATRLFNEMGWLLPAGAVFVFIGLAGQITAGILFYFAYEAR